MRIAAYCRVSTEKEEQLDSLEHQREFFEEYARKQGHNLIRLYADEGISGTSLRKRDQFLRLMNDAKLGLFEMVVVKDVSRLARNTVDFLQSIRTLKSLGVNTLFLTANMDSLGESEFVLTLFGAMAQEESANLSKRVKFGKKINAQKGRVPQRIFGYDRLDNFTLGINLKEANVVREIYRLYIEEGLGCRTISLRLNEMGCKTKYDCEWNPRGVRRVLTNPIYCGHYINNKYEIEDYLTGKQVHIPEEQQFHHERPEWAIIPKETYDTAQRMLEERREQYRNNEVFKGARYSSKHIFSTLIKCEHCGRSFCRKHYEHVNTGARVYWKCTTNDQYTAQRCDNTVKLEEDELLEEIREYFASLIHDRKAFIQSVMKDLDKSNATTGISITERDVERKRKQVIAKKERYQEMYVNDVITMSELKCKMELISQEMEELDYQLKRCQRLANAKADDRFAVEQYTGEIEKFLNLETVTNMDLRRVIDHISVNRNGNVRIVLKKLNFLTEN